MAEGGDVGVAPIRKVMGEGATVADVASGLRLLATVNGGNTHVKMTLTCAQALALARALEAEPKTLVVERARAEVGLLEGCGVAALVYLGLHFVVDLTAWVLS